MLETADAATSKWASHEAPYIHKGYTRESLLGMVSDEERLDIGMDNLKLAIAVCDGEKLAERFPRIKADLEYIKSVRDASNYMGSEHTRQCSQGSLGLMTAMLPTEVFAMMVAACPDIDSNKNLWNAFLSARSEYSVIKRR